MEPLTITAIATKALIGYTGHGFNTITDKGLSVIPRIIKRMRKNGDLPPNHDLYKALRLSMLDATHYLTNIANGLVELNEIAQTQSELANWRLFKIYSNDWISFEKKIINEYLAPDKDNSSAYAEIEKILSSDKDETIKSLRKDLEKKVKQEWLKEWQMGSGMDIPEIAEKLLMEGCIIEEKTIDWFNITTLLFAEYLKEAKHVKAKDAFQNRLLSEIKTETGIITDKLDDLTELFSKTINNYDFIKTKLIEQDHFLIELKGTTEQTFQYVKEIFTALNGAISLDKLQNNESISNLLEKIKRLESEVIKFYDESEEYKSELVANPLSKSTLKAYNSSLVEWQKSVNYLQKCKEDFQNIKTAYIRQKEVFDNIDWETANDRLKKSRNLFYEGATVNELESILLYEHRDEDLEILLKEKERVLNVSKNFAEEELMLALNRLRDTEDKERFKKAKKHFETSIIVYEDYNNCKEYGFFLNNQNYHKESIKIYQKALTYIGKEELKERAIVLNNLGNLFFDIKLYSDAESYLFEALSIRRKLAENEPETVESELSTTLNNLGILFCENRQYKKGEVFFLEAISLQRKLTKENPDVFEADLAKSLNNMAILYRILERYTDAESLISENLDIARRLAEKESGSNEHFLAFALLNQGMLHYKAKRYSDAENNYSKAVSIYRRLAEKNPDAFEPQLSNILNNLGDLYFAINRYDNADSNYSEALSINRRHVERNPDVFEGYLAATLNNRGTLLRNLERFDEAASCFSEAMQLYLKYYSKNSNLYFGRLVRVCLKSAHMLLELDKKEKAYECTLTAVKLLYPYKDEKEYQLLFSVANKFLIATGSTLEECLKNLDI